MAWSLSNLLLVVVSMVLMETVTPKNPCLRKYHKELDDPHRSTGFKTGKPLTPLCDIHLVPGWYRFTSKAGGQMPTTCPDRMKCGSDAPIWMDGTHPSAKEGIVPRKACVNLGYARPGRNPCCGQSFQIKVKNCQTFYVYYLHPTPSCSRAYCAGSVPPCPVGTWSPTSFAPCGDDHPVYNVPPTLEGPEIVNKAFFFRCNIEFNGTDPQQRFEVVWTFDGKEDRYVPHEILEDPSRTATLDGKALWGHINTNVRCKVRTFYTTFNTSLGKRSHGSPYLESNSYYAGIRMSPSKLTLREDEDFARTINITSTIPLLCDLDINECCLQFILDNDTQNTEYKYSSCDYKLCREDWDNNTRTATTSVPLFSKQDMINDGDKHVLVAFQELSPNGGPYLGVFSEHTPDRIQVEVKDEKTFTCSIVTDPHITGHDFGPYHLYLKGDFTVYSVPSRDFLVQIRTWICYKGGKTQVTCICGVVIRERDDIIRVDQCNQVYGAATTSPKVEKASNLSEGTIVQRSEDGSKIGVYLPSGSEIKIEANSKYINLYITTPGIDKKLARGLCGTNDGNKDNEFMHPDGKIDAMCKAGTHCRPNNFFKSWSPADEDNLFKTDPPLLNYTDNTTAYCQCTNVTDVSSIKCTNRNTACPKDCRDVTNKIPKIPLGKSKSNVKRDVVFEDDDTPDVPYSSELNDLPPANDDQTLAGQAGANTITEAQAEKICQDALYKSKLWTRCSGIKNIAATILDNCALDVRYGGIEFASTVTDQLNSECQLELAKDPDNYVTDPKGVVIMKPELLTDICPSACDKNGHCGKHGICICNKGFEGNLCQLESGVGPILHKIRSGPICDTQARPCQRIYIDASNLAMTDSLDCKVQPVDDGDKAVGNPVTTSALFLTAGRIACDLPKTKISSQSYKVSASRDGQLYGTELKIRVFDSRCLKCDVTQCTEKSAACHISNHCYDDLQVNPVESAQHCNITNNTTDWTRQPRLPYTPTLTGPNADHMFVCKVNAPPGDTGPFNVMWYINSKEQSPKTLKPRRTSGYLSPSILPSAGKLKCKVEVNGASSESNELDYVKKP